MLIYSRTLTLATLIALVGCTNPDGSPNQAGTGAVIGGVAGAALGNAAGHSPQSTLIGGAIGAAVGGAIGTDMARQEQELNQNLAGSGALVSNDGQLLRLILPESVTFATGSSTVSTSFLPALREVARSLIAHPNSKVLVVGHTDNVGTSAYNQQLSEDRALAVARILVSYGVSPSRITYSGHGQRDPIATNSNSFGREQNRRVEILITPTQ